VRVSWAETPGFILQTTTNLNTVPGSLEQCARLTHPYNTSSTEAQRFFVIEAVKPLSP
jgi:hypothetical protein